MVGSVQVRTGLPSEKDRSRPAWTGLVVTGLVTGVREGGNAVDQVMKLLLHHTHAANVRAGYRQFAFGDLDRGLYMTHNPRYE